MCPWRHHSLADFSPRSHGPSNRHTKCFPDLQNTSGKTKFLPDWSSLSENALPWKIKMIPTVLYVMSLSYTDSSASYLRKQEENRCECFQFGLVRLKFYPRQTFVARHILQILPTFVFIKWPVKAFDVWVSAWWGDRVLPEPESCSATFQEGKGCVS